jgi:hypothetical protein
MKVFTVLLFIAFLFTGAKPMIQPERQIKPLTDSFQALPSRLNQLSEKMEALSHKVKGLK